MIVVDASAMIEVLLRLPAAEMLLDRMTMPEETLHAPHLMDVEVAQVMRRYWRAGDITPARASQALEDLEGFPLTRYGHGPLLARIWQLRANATAYDATYIALAEALGAVLVTRDAAMSRLPGGRAEVQVF